MKMNEIITTTNSHWNTEETSIEHNERDEELCSKESHIDLENKHGDSFHEVLFEKSVFDVYEENLSEAIEEFNENCVKKKHPERRTDTQAYMEKIILSERGRKQTKKTDDGKRIENNDARQGQQLYYEFVTSVGNSEKAHDADGNVLYDDTDHQIRPEMMDRDIQKKVLGIYHNGGTVGNKTFPSWQDRNPTLKTMRVDIHGDEGYYNSRGKWEYGVIHSHSIVIPFSSKAYKWNEQTRQWEGHEYKRGLKVQQSMSGALGELGYYGVDAYNKWSAHEKEILKEILLEVSAEHDLSVKVHTPVRDANREGDKSNEEYKQAQEDVIALRSSLKAQAENLRDMEEKTVKSYKKQDSEYILATQARNGYNKAKQTILSMTLKDADEYTREYMQTEEYKKGYSKFLDEKLKVADIQMPEQLENPEYEIKRRRKSQPEEEKKVEVSEKLVNKNEAPVTPEEPQKEVVKINRGDTVDDDLEIPEEFRDDPMGAWKWYQENMYKDI